MSSQQEPSSSPHRRSLRRRVAFLVLVVGAAGLLAYWSRQRSVDVTLVYDFGRLAPRVVRLTLSLAREGEDAQPVVADFPSDKGAPRRYRHRLSLRPGRYILTGRVRLRALLDAREEVRRIRRVVQVKPGQDQRIVLRLGL